MGDNSKTMEVKEFSFEVLSTAVDFMYGIDIPEDFYNNDVLTSLLHLADLYLMEDLKDAVGFLIGKDINKENVFDTSRLADKFRAVALGEKCVEFFFDNATTIEDEKLAEMREGTVMVSLAKKFVMESKKEQWKESWLTKLFGEKPDFKKQDDFGSEEEYKGYVMAIIETNMFVMCNKSSRWFGPHWVVVEAGHDGFVTSTNASGGHALVKWLTPNAGDPVAHLIGYNSSADHACLDLLTSPVNFTC